MKIIIMSIVMLASCVYTFAAQNTQNMNSTIKLEGRCEITIPDIVVGKFTPSKTDSIIQAKKIEVKCTKKVNYNILVDKGSSNLITNRYMVSLDQANTDKLRYALYYNIMLTYQIVF